MNDEKYNAEILLNHLRPAFYKVLSIPRKYRKQQGTYYFTLTNIRQIYPLLNSALKASKLECFKNSNLLVVDLYPKINNIKLILGKNTSAEFRRGCSVSQKRYQNLVAAFKECLDTCMYDFEYYNSKGQENINLIISTIKAKLNISTESKTSPMMYNSTELEKFLDGSLSMLEEEVIRYLSKDHVEHIWNIRKILDIPENSVTKPMSLSVDKFNQVIKLLNLILSSFKKDTQMSESNSYPMPTPLVEHVFSHDVQMVLKELGDMLIEKNRKYGNSALDPSRVFSRSDTVEQLKVRIDSKINRIRNGSINGDGSYDSIKDLVGYLVLLLIALQRQSK